MRGFRNSHRYNCFRLFADRFIALILLIILTPVLVVACLLVKIDGGPIVFRQQRLGKNAQEFAVLKLRTMIVDADKYLNENGMPTRKRTTAVGDFLRKSSIDELPQLLNILRGEMALIGPRPILPRMLPYMTKRERHRFDVSPGVTGLAQVKGRNLQKWSRRFKYDVFYSQNTSFCLDAYIAILTIRTVFSSGNVAADINRDQVDDVTTRNMSGIST